MAEQITIKVRFAQGTYLARAKGYKQTASCVESPAKAALALARKLDLDASSLVGCGGTGDYEEYQARPLRRLPRAWKMVPVLPTLAMAAAGKRALEAGGDADAVFAAMLEQAPCPEAWPGQGSVGVREG